MHVILFGQAFRPIQFSAGDLRFHADGSPVTSFGTNGVRLDAASPFGPSDPLGTMLSDGTYLYASTTQTSVTLVHHDATGQLDTSFGNNGQTTVGIDDFANLDEELLDNDGKFLMIGTSLDSQGTRQLFILRLLPDGQVDPSFGAGGVEYFPVNGVAIEQVKQIGRTLEVLVGADQYPTVGPETFQLIDFAL